MKVVFDPPHRDAANMQLQVKCFDCSVDVIEQIHGLAQIGKVLFGNNFLVFIMLFQNIGSISEKESSGV